MQAEDEHAGLNLFGGQERETASFFAQLHLGLSDAHLIAGQSLSACGWIFAVESSELVIQQAPGRAVGDLPYLVSRVR